MSNVTRRAGDEPKPLFTRLNIILGVAMLFLVAVVGSLYYFKEYKPVQTEAQKQVQTSFTFSLSCVVQEPLKGVYRPWLKENAWTYEIPCVSKNEAEAVSNGVENLLPKPGPGLHFITVADSALVSNIDWLKIWKENPDLDMSLESTVAMTQSLPSFDFRGMSVYELYLKPQYRNGRLLMNFVCHEEFDADSRLVKYLCSSD